MDGWIVNHIRQMAHIVDADANSLVSAGEVVRERAHAGLCHASVPLNKRGLYRRYGNSTPTERPLFRRDHS